MVWLAFVLLACLPQTASGAQAHSAKPPEQVAVGQKTDAVDAPAEDAQQLARKLLHIRRIYVESFGDDPVSKQLQATVISSLSESKRFIVTENRDKADAVLRGAALEKTSQEVHALGDAAAAGTAVGGHSASISGTVVNGTGTVSGSSSGGFAARTVAADDSVVTTETINEARVAVRLVLPDGDIVWTTKQESRGAKYKGAAADVADKVVKQLLRDLEKLEKPREQPDPTK